jgi:hypothetical protein
VAAKLRKIVSMVSLMLTMAGLVWSGWFSRIARSRSENASETCGENQAHFEEFLVSRTGSLLRHRNEWMFHGVGNVPL